MSCLICEENGCIFKWVSKLIDIVLVMSVVPGPEAYLCNEPNSAEPYIPILFSYFHKPDC